MRNIFACLVHERPDCVLDLVRNLHHLDPDSLILLYNGGNPPGLLDAARDLVALRERDEQLRDILRRSRIWASEEVLFPTLTALLGHRVLTSPWVRRSSPFANPWRRT
ncbi:hypothetical protein LXT21_37405 [Myxococcus sp. K38C18041901]|uniref:hypothetical protein n=1 Tax=Myxococcus guangdongensis TaxID=2906760 RepID=UPI0020A7722B|nr:hypothetical protein [Myxococcus guangdongensis]MCP3064466.1 hypothetical protein [Myxococcus guangdongensis]